MSALAFQTSHSAGRLKLKRGSGISLSTLLTCRVTTVTTAAQCRCSASKGGGRGMAGEAASPWRPWRSAWPAPAGPRCLQRKARVGSAQSQLHSSRRFRSLEVQAVAEARLANRACWASPLPPLRFARAAYHAHKHVVRGDQMAGLPRAAWSQGRGSHRERTRAAASADLPSNLPSQDTPAEDDCHSVLAVS